MSRDATPYGLVLGRFQPFHLDHLAYVRAAADRSGHLVVGLTNPTAEPRFHTELAAHRSEARANPFSYFDRVRMLAATLHDEFGPGNRDWTIVPAALGSTEFTAYMPPSDQITCYLTISDAWGQQKRQLVEQAGIQTDVMWERPLAQNAITGSTVRELIYRGAPWQHLVPAGAARVIETQVQALQRQWGSHA